MTEKVTENIIGCDVCGTEEGVECEILLKGDQVDRIYHLCPRHWIKVYRKTLEDFLEANEYKTNSYIKMACDKLISDSMTGDKIKEFSDAEGLVNVDRLAPQELRKIRPYKSDDSSDDDYE